MIKLLASECANICGGRLSGPDCEIQGVAIDSRRVEPGNLFAALGGSRVDGHRFVPAARSQGAAAVLVSAAQDDDASQIVVDDVQQALGRLAAHWRRQCPATVIGITGSNGKTTVKEMLGSILSLRHRVRATEGNYNNELGLPLTLFSLSSAHDYAVLELGASRAGDIRYLADICQPSIGLVNNAGPAHLEGFGSLDGVAEAKGELFEALGEDGWAIINGDQSWNEQWCRQSGAARRLVFGFAEQADIRGYDGRSGRLVIEHGEERIEVTLPLPGAHNRMNALAAAAAARALGIPMQDIQQGLEAVRPVPGRLNAIVSAGGWTVIDDTYNANPASLYAGIQVLAEQSTPAWLVLGDMAELGPDARKLHAEMGGAAASLGVKRLYAVGPLSTEAVDAFGHGARHFDSKQALIDALLADIGAQITCLVKGSRSAGMEDIVEALLAPEVRREAV